MRIDEAATDAVVHAALDAGITLFDTADIYGGTKSGEFLGRALGNRRDEAIVATKFGGRVSDERAGGARADYVRLAVDDSLRRLGTDRIDLYQLHFPDAETPIEDTLGALDELVRAGKVREIGCSNFSVEQLAAADAASSSGGLARFVSVQNEYSLKKRDPERGVLDACEEYDLAFIPYFPLASGVLTGKYRRGEAPPEGTRLSKMPAERVGQALSDANLDKVEALEGWARDHGHSLLDLAMAWLLGKPRVASVIAGATKPEQVVANAHAASWALSAADVAEVDAIAG
jgi:aryl-alcohol dehydrogenase-like predicted oxidoreductase